MVGYTVWLDTQMVRYTEWLNTQMVRYTVWLDTQMVGYTVWLDTQSRRPRIARDPAIPEKRDSPRSDGRTDTYTAADPGYTPERYTDRYLSDVFLSCISHQVGGYTRGSDSVYLICAYISGGACLLPI